MENPDAKVSSIFVYPVKSCRGISISQAPLTPTGFRWDRNWLVINSEGRACTQKHEPQLALVQIELPSEAFSEDWEPTKNTYMVVKAPGMGVLNISMSKSTAVVDGISYKDWSGAALDEGDEAANWFTNFLGKPFRLVRFDGASETRLVSPVYAPGHKLMFSNSFPYNMISQPSLDALNRHLTEPVPINRFRPSILLDGCGPFSEDLWTEIRISKFTFQGVRLNSRCKIPDINQETGIAGSEPNKTLRAFRSDKVLRPNRKQQGKIYLGQDLVLKDSLNREKGTVIKVGDPIFVINKVSSAAEAAA